MNLRLVFLQWFYRSLQIQLFDFADYFNGHKLASMTMLRADPTSSLNMSPCFLNQISVMALVGSRIRNVFV